MSAKSKPSNEHDVADHGGVPFVPEDSSYDYGLAGLTALTAIALAVLIVFWISLSLAKLPYEAQEMPENNLNITHGADSGSK